MSLTKEGLQGSTAVCRGLQGLQGSALVCGGRGSARVLQGSAWVGEEEGDWRE
jgi:hypothetical protein